MRECVSESRQSVEQTSDQSAPLLAMVVWRKTDVARMMIIVVCVGCDDNDDVSVHALCVCEGTIIKFTVPHIEAQYIIFTKG